MRRAPATPGPTRAAGAGAVGFGTVTGVTVTVLTCGAAVVGAGADWLGFGAGTLVSIADTGRVSTGTAAGGAAGDRLLLTYPGANGVKTGTTNAAGRCLVSSARRGDVLLIAVVLNGGDTVFRDSALLLDYGFRVLGK